MATLPFNIDKAIQAAALVINASGSNRMDFIRALKILYIAERRALLETGHQLVGERLVAMKNGPLHSYLYDLCKGEGRAEDKLRWDEFLEKVDYRLVVKSDPGLSKLSEFETDLIASVVAQHRDMGTWDLVESTHQFPEWKKRYPDVNESTSRTIQLADLIDDPEQLASIEDEIMEESRLAEILRC